MAGRISEYIDAPKLVGTELMDLSVVDGGSPSGYVTRKVTIDDFLTDFPNLYSDSGTLGGNRTVNQSGNTLYFNDGDWGVDFSNKGIMYDDLTKRVGFGEATPLAKVHIKGGIGDRLFFVEDSIGSDVFEIDELNNISFHHTSPEAPTHIKTINGFGTYIDGLNVSASTYILKLRDGNGDDQHRFRSSGRVELCLDGDRFQLGAGAGVYHFHQIAPTAGGSSATIHSVDSLGGSRFEVKANGRILLGNLPTSTTGLVAGDLWNNAGVINIV